MLVSLFLAISCFVTAVVCDYANMSWIGTLYNNMMNYVDTVTDLNGDFIVSY